MMDEAERKQRIPRNIYRALDFEIPKCGKASDFISVITNLIREHGEDVHIEFVESFCEVIAEVSKVRLETEGEVESRVSRWKSLYARSCPTTDPRWSKEDRKSLYLKLRAEFDDDTSVS